MECAVSRCEKERGRGGKSEGGGWTSNEPTSNGDADADAATKIDADSEAKCSLRAAGKEHKGIGKSQREEREGEREG